MFISSLTNAHEIPPVKVFQDGDSVRVGIYLGCSFTELSPIVTPNIIITHINNHFDIIMSLRVFPFNRCSPPPPEFIDEGRLYYDLGDLPSGQYTINANYVIDDASLPPQPGVQIYEFDQTGFSVALAVPVLNNYSTIFLIFLFGSLSYKFRKKLFN